MNQAAPFFSGLYGKHHRTNQPVSCSERCFWAKMKWQIVPPVWPGSSDAEGTLAVAVNLISRDMTSAIKMPFEIEKIRLLCAFVLMLWYRHVTLCRKLIEVRNEQG